MSVYQCDCCGAVDNTATSKNGHRRLSLFMWDFVQSTRGLKLCFRCGPIMYRDNNLTKEADKDWHNRFHLDYLPLGEYEQVDYALVHKETRKMKTSGDYVLPPTHYTVTSTGGEEIQLAEAAYPRRQLLRDLWAGKCELKIEDVGVYVKGEQPEAPPRPLTKFSLLG